MEVRHGLLKPTKIILHHPLSLLHDLLRSLLLSCCQSLETFFIFCHGCILIGVVVERKLSSTEDVGEGKATQDSQNQSESDSFCASMSVRSSSLSLLPQLPRSQSQMRLGALWVYEPSALNHFAPFWRFEKFGYGHHGAAGL